MTRSKASLIIVLALLVNLFATFFTLSPAWGQEVTAAITGSVTDPSGAPVVGASVLAHDVERGTTYPTRTNDVGVFNLARLPVGNYEIKVEATGFQTAEQSRDHTCAEPDRPLLLPTQGKGREPGRRSCR